jgi:hypothetical protein
MLELIWACARVREQDYVRLFISFISLDLPGHELGSLFLISKFIHVIELNWLSKIHSASDSYKYVVLSGQL